MRFGSIGEPLLDGLDFLADYGIVIVFGCLGFAIFIFFTYIWGSLFLGLLFDLHDRVRPSKPADGRIARHIRD